MLRNHLFLVSLLFSFFCIGQSHQQADDLFENFEFSAAAEFYNHDRSRLSNEQFNRLAYCYFIENNAEKGLSLTDSLLKQGSPNIELWYYKAHFERDLAQFENALTSAEKYLGLSGENLPLKFRESCYINLNTPEIIDGEVQNYSGNDRKINSVNLIGDFPVYLYEIGIDSLGTKIGFAANKGVEAQGLLIKPFIERNGKMEEWVCIDEPGKELSINSVQFDKKEGKLYFTAAMPSTVDPLLLVSHIYVAEISEIGSTVNSFVPWIYSGYEDSSSCAHLALSADGNTLVFSKLLKGREDGDLYYSSKTNGTWSKPTPIPGINTLSHEVFPTISGDTLLFFSSDGHIGYGGLDIFSIPFTSDWSHDTLTRLPLPLNSTSDDFNYYPQRHEVDAIFVSNRKNGEGDDDIWTFKKPVIVPEPEPEPEPVVVELVEPKKPEFDVNAFLNECNSKRIYFSFNEGATADKFDFVEKLKQLEGEGYKFNIIITGYADARGTVPANYQVGMRRAESVKKDLISRGLKAESMKCESMGSTKIENRCKNPKIQCSEEEHKVNRYVQLTISVVE
jgi:outer membrane protein OmpA-like peptidoglycan-associated protein